MKLHWRKIFDGCWHGFIGDDLNPTMIVEQNSYGRRLWTIEHNGHGRVVKGMYDCFSLKLAKQYAQERLDEVTSV